MHLNFRPYADIRSLRWIQNHAITASRPRLLLQNDSTSSSQRLLEVSINLSRSFMQSSCDSSTYHRCQAQTLSLIRSTVLLLRAKCMKHGNELRKADRETRVHYTQDQAARMSAIPAIYQYNLALVALLSRMMFGIVVELGRSI